MNINLIRIFGDRRMKPMRYLQVFFLAVVLLILSGCAMLNPTMPVKIPIDLSKAGSVAEAEFWIPQDDRIEIYICFIVNDKLGNGKSLSEIIGGLDKSGIKIPLDIQLLKSTGGRKNEVILEKLYITQGLGKTHFEPKYYFRSIDRLTVKSGKYHLIIKNAQSIPELARNKVELRIYNIRPSIM